MGNKLALTPSGQNLLEHVRQMGNAAVSLSMAAVGQAHDIVGNICISATEVMAAYVLAPILKKLRLKAPGITIEIIASNQASDLRKREADIAVRNFEPKQNDLIARRLQDGSAYLYANPIYLEKLKKPLTKATLSQADFVGFRDNAPYIQALQGEGIAITERNFPIITESHIVHWEVVKSG